MSVGLMSTRDLIGLIRGDLFRYGGRGFLAFLRIFWLDPGFSATFWFRVCQWRKASRLRRSLFFPFVFFRRRSERVYHTVIAGEIGPGLCVGHAIAGGIIMNDKTRIGKNCNIHHGVTIGVKNRGCAVGVPVFGDNVYIGPGAKVIGGIRIGNNVAIGANAVVTHDVPDNAVVGGVPAKIISFNGSLGLINRCV